MLKIKFEIRFLAVGSRKWPENDRKLAKMAEFCRKMAKKGVGQDHNLNRCSCGMLVSWRIIILELILEHSKNFKNFENWKIKKWKKSLISFFFSKNKSILKTNINLKSSLILYWIILTLLHSITLWPIILITKMILT